MQQSPVRHLASPSSRPASASLAEPQQPVEPTVIRAAPGASRFHDEGEACLRDLRDAVAGTLRSVGASLDTPQEVSRAFGLDKTLAWKLSRLVLEADVIASVVHAPRLPGLLLFEKAMARAQAPARELGLLRGAIERFEQFVASQAGDRDVMEIMLTTPGQGRSSNARRLELFRKDGFVSNSAIWGVSTRVHVALRWVMPSKVPGMLDLATACGFVGFRRLRSDVPWTVSTLLSWNAGDAAGTTSPIPGMGANAQMPLLSEYCSQPLPAIRIAMESATRQRLIIDAGPVGNTALADVLVGWVLRGVAPMRASVAGEQGEHGALLSTPAELFLHDVFIHKSLAFAQAPSAQIYGMLPGGPQYPGTDVPAQALPVPCELAEIGPGTPTPEMPRYGALVSSVVHALEQSPADFAGYRLRVKYPPIPSMSLVRHALKEQ